MTSGALARRVGLSVKAVREYADAGLIYSVGRSRAGYRLFEEEALWCVDVIKGLRELGLTVVEIRKLSGPAEQLGPRLARSLEKARSRTSQRIEELQRILDRIDAFEATHRAELAGEAVLRTGDPRRGD